MEKRCAINKDRRNIAEATKLLGLKSRKAFKKFAKKLRVNPNILACKQEKKEYKNYYLGHWATRDNSYEH